MPSPSRVLIDGYFWGKPYGFGRYIEELVHSLHKLGSGPDIVVALPDRGTGQTLPPVETITAPHRAFPLWEQFTVPDLAKRAGAGLVHFPSNTAALRRRGLPALVTVHDLFFIDHPSQGGFKDRVYSQYSRTAFSLATRRAERIVSVGEETGLALGDAPTPGGETALGIGADEGAILTAMTALTDPAPRDELVRRGTARYPTFSGARMAETYVDPYRQLLAGHAGETR